MSEQPPVRRVMISSTALDLPEHRRHARDACERMSMLPLVMEQMPASPADALALSRKYVDQADFYLGIFAFRYGFVPEGQDKSITELEYDRAVERGIPPFIFIACAETERAVSPEFVETGNGALKLKALKERLQNRHVVGNCFHSAEELRTEIILALSAYRQDDAAKLHYVAEIPPPPTPWVAHWYSLLGNRSLIGRRAELNLLTDWVANPASEAYNSRLLALVAIGGMGKSALAWTWFNEIAPQEMKPLAGRMWWSFYESDARLENFTARALAYLTGKPRVETEQIPARDREDQLIAILDREPHLIVLDGLERELVAYARLDAAHLADEDLDARTAHTIARPAGLPATAAQSFVGEAKLRQTTDPRGGHFLRRLTQVRATRILVTTRLFPYDLQDFNGEPLRGTSVLCLGGLSDDDAVALWQSAGISGARNVLIPLFRSFDGHPLLVRALAGEIARDRRSAGNFEVWRKQHPGFNPFALPLVQRKSHVLAFALEGLSPNELALLRAIAGFRMPAAYETLVALLLRKDAAERPPKHGAFSGALARLVGTNHFTVPFSSEEALDGALAHLDNRGLVGWDRRANRYDLHPIVRGVVWSGAAGQDRQAITERMRGHFESISRHLPVLDFEPKDYPPMIELFASLVRLGRLDEASDLFLDRMDPTMFSRGASRLRVELLEMLFPDGLEQLPRLRNRLLQTRTLCAIGEAYLWSGEPRRAVMHLQHSVALLDNLRTFLPMQRREAVMNLSMAYGQVAALHAAEASALNLLAMARAEHTVIDWFYHPIGFWRVVRGFPGGHATLNRALSMSQKTGGRHLEGIVSGFVGQSALWRGEAAASMLLADRAWELADDERDFISAARLQGQAALALDELERADERLHHALTRARGANDVQEELAALTALGELCRRRGDTVRARQQLDAVWDAAERAPYPLLHADARNVLAQIEITENDLPAAIAAATAAYRLAWCDGPPFAYDYGLRTARAQLAALGAPEPEMPPYDSSKHEPIEEIDIDRITLEGGYSKLDSEEP